MNITDYGKIKQLKKPEDIFDLRNRVVVIIGGAGKMGDQFARSLAFAGAQVVIADINEEICKKLAQSISMDTNSEVLGCKCNVNDEEQIVNLFEDVYREYKRIDVLVYNVMAKPEGYYEPLDQYTIETWTEVVRGNLTGAFICCREASKYMEKGENGGSIIITLSIYGLVGPDQRIYQSSSAEGSTYAGGDPLSSPPPYSASKAGLLGLVKYLATSLRKSNIRVNGLTPGGVYDGQGKKFHDEYVKRTPLGRMATWSDYNGAILFLASDASRYMTGSNLVVDGGWTAW